MILLIIALVLTLIIAFWLSDGDMEMFLHAFAMCGLVLGAGAFGIAAFVGAQHYPELLPREKRTDLLSVVDNVTSNGRFVLGSGTVEGNITYFYYVKDGAGFRVGKTTATNLLLLEDQEKDAFLLEYESDVDMHMWGITFSSYKGPELHIPKGTIIKGVHELDLK